LPDVTGQYCMLAIYFTLGIIFFFIEVKDIGDIVQIPYSKSKESIVDKITATVIYNVLCWTLKIKWVHQYSYMLFKNQDNPILDK
jgi:hypothetical protein